LYFFPAGAGGGGAGAGAGPGGEGGGGGRFGVISPEVHSGATVALQAPAQFEYRSQMPDDALNVKFPHPG
jgi:hypothetical protein